MRGGLFTYRVVVTPTDARAPAGDRSDHRRAGDRVFADHGPQRRRGSVLRSGPAPGLVSQAGTWSLAALAWLIVFKGLAYGLSLGSFRGGPTFPALFLGAAAGIMASHLPGFPSIGRGAGGDGRRDRRGAQAAAVSRRARDAAHVARRAEGRAADHRRRGSRICRDPLDDTPAGAGLGSGARSRGTRATGSKRVTQALGRDRTRLDRDTPTLDPLGVDALSRGSPRRCADASANDRDPSGSSHKERKT